MWPGLLHLWCGVVGLLLNAALGDHDQPINAQEEEEDVKRLSGPEVVIWCRLRWKTGSRPQKPVGHAITGVVVLCVDWVTDNLLKLGRGNSVSGM